jgi:hypothetical protein
MRHSRRIAAALTVLAAVTTTAACGTAQSPAAAPAPVKAVATVSATATATATATQVRATAPAMVRKPGTDPGVYAAKPRIKVGPASQFMLSPAEQRSAAVWLDGFMHRSHLDFSKLPSTRTPGLWTAEMTPKRHAGFAKAVKDKVPTFGTIWSAEDRSMMRATKVSEYTITARRDYMAADYQEGAAFLVRMVVDYDVYGDGTTERPDTKGRLITSLTIGVVPGSNGHRWQMASWDYEGGSSSWQRLDETGHWVKW